MDKWIDTGKRIICSKHLLEDCDLCKDTSVSSGSYGALGDLDENTVTNHMLGGRVGLAYSPHNARFYFQFDKWNFKPSADFHTINSADLCLDLFHGCRFVVRKSLIEVTNKVDPIRVFSIQGSVDEREGLVRSANNTLKLEAIKAFKHFVQAFGGASDFVCVKEWIPDHKVSKHPIFNSVIGSTWRDDDSKHVYPDEAHIEASSQDAAIRVVRNLAIHDSSKEIEERLDRIDSDLLNFRKDALEPLTAQIKLHLEVMNEMKETMRNINQGIKILGSTRIKEQWGW